MTPAALRADYRPPALQRAAAAVCLCVALLLALVAPAFAHGGPPLRLGVTTDPALSAVARLVLVHLREGVGFAVDWREYRDDAALQAAFAAGRLDIAVGLTHTDRLPQAPPPGGSCPSALLPALREDLRVRWGAEVFLLGFPAGPPACVLPALVLSRGVLEDLRFGILGKEAARVAALITREDLAAVRAAFERGGERAATAAARAALAAKATR
jgi:hypothetical protein